MNSCLYEGWVSHRRFVPVKHSFRYRVFQVCLDLSELDTVFAGRWFWSTKRFAVAWFRRQDHVGDPSLPWTNPSAARLPGPRECAPLGRSGC